MVVDISPSLTFLFLREAFVFFRGGEMGSIWFRVLTYE
jgi:hypothetical protein